MLSFVVSTPASWVSAVDVVGWVVAADRRRALEEDMVVSATTGGADTSRLRFLEPSVVVPMREGREVKEKY